jgi:predicted dehydrogenase
MTAPRPDRPPLRAAVVGAGQIGRWHLACLRRLGVRVAAVCDRSAVTAEAAAGRFGVPAWFTDHERMLDAIRPDALHVATGVATHGTIARAALAAGAHVVVEKPAARDHPELAALLAEAQRRERLLTVDHSYVFAPAVQRCLELRRRGDLGTVVHTEVAFALDVLAHGSRFVTDGHPHPSARLPGGPLSDFLPHLASLAHALIGPHEEVRTLRVRRSSGHALPWDELRALVLGREATATLSFSAHAQPDVLRVRVEGSRLRAETNLFDAGLRVSRKRHGYRPLQPVWNGFAEGASAAIGPLHALALKVRGTPPAYAGLHELLRRTYGALAGAGTAPVPADDALAVQRLVDELARDGRG